MTDFSAERIEGQESMVNVAALQFAPVLGQCDSNRDKLVELATKAFDQQAQLIVAPEACVSGYVFNNRQEATECAESLPDGPTVKALAKLTAKYNGYIVAGLIEKEGELLYNTAVLVGPEGFIGKYRKVHLWDVDNTLYEAGNEFPVFDLPFGRLGISICYDGMFPEVARIYAAKGVDILCHPTNWVVVPGIAEETNPAWVFMAAGQAACSAIIMVCADRIGTERGVTFGGNSCMCGLTGMLAGPAPFAEEAVLLAPVNIMDARRKQVSAWNHLMRDRRTDLYDETLGYKG
jgi:N-carbamoylputrescine amidase